MIEQLSYENFFVLRSPLLSIESTRDIGVDKLKLLYNNEQIQEALFIASPEVYARLKAWLIGVILPEKEQYKLENTLRKYLLRMAYRCTPFGLYAGVAVGNWAPATDVRFVGAEAYVRKSRLDMNFICALAQKITTDPELRMVLQYQPNNTLYQTDQQYRYVEYASTKDTRTHNLVTIQASPYVAQVLAQAVGGAARSALATALISEDISAAEAAAFVDELIDNQVIVSQLEPGITGGTYLPKVIAFLQQHGLKPELVELLGEVEALLAALDESMSNHEAVYAQLYACVRRLGVPFDENQLLQVDMFKPAQAATISHHVTQEIQAATEFLARLTPFQEAPKLKRFQQRFLAKYDQQEVPLLQALDVDLGLGYPVSEQPYEVHSPLVAGIPHGAKENEMTRYAWTTWHNLLFEKRQQAYQNGQTEIELTPQEVAPFLKPNVELPTSLYAVTSLLANSPAAVDRGEFSVVLDSVAGPSMANFLGRFCHLDAALQQQVQQALRREEAQRPDAIFAEIVHFNQARIGNISARPVLRDYEIPIVVSAGVDHAHTLPLHDLWLSVRGEQLRLRSRRLNREVIPRLSSAHNFSLNALPVYHFLGDLQFQGAHRLLEWHWGALENVDHLPRVRYGRTILAAARWTLVEADVHQLKTAAAADLCAVGATLRQRWQLPQWVVFAEYDNRIPIDLASKEHLMVLQSLIKNRRRLVLEECLHQQNWVQGSSDGTFTNELVVPLRYTPSRAARPLLPAAPAPATLIARSFPLGSEWLYAKLYCGPATADEILAEVIHPLATDLLAHGHIDQWFFVRYQDPNPHLRVRFHGNDAFYGPVIARLHAALEPYRRNGQVHAIQYDTYERELERYGADTMRESEEIFFHDSEAVAALLAHLREFDLAGSRWPLAVRGVDELLTNFGLSVAEKKEFAALSQAGFLQEFSLTAANTRKLLGAKYRAERGTVERVLGQQWPVTSAEAQLQRIFDGRSAAMAGAVACVRRRCAADAAYVPLTALLDSYVHMFINRFFPAKQRLHEAVIYDFLLQYYTSVLARTRQPEPVTG